MLMFARHTGQQSSVATLFAQLSQKRACPHDTSANPIRRATRQSSQQSAGSSAAAAAGHGAVEVVAVDAVDCSSSLLSSLLLSLSMADYNAVVTGADRMADGTQELETIVGTDVEPRQTCLDALLALTTDVLMRSELYWIRPVMFCSINSIQKITRLE